MSSSLQLQCTIIVNHRQAHTHCVCQTMKELYWRHLFPQWLSLHPQSSAIAIKAAKKVWRSRIWWAHNAFFSLHKTPESTSGIQALYLLSSVQGSGVHVPLQVEDMAQKALIGKPVEIRSQDFVCGNLEDQWTSLCLHQLLKPLSAYKYPILNLLTCRWSQNSKSMP